MLTKVILKFFLAPIKFLRFTWRIMLGSFQLLKFNKNNFDDWEFCRKWPIGVTAVFFKLEPAVSIEAIFGLFFKSIRLVCRDLEYPGSWLKLVSEIMMTSEIFQELSRVRGDIAAEKLTTNRLLHQNEKLQAEVAELKKTSKVSNRNHGESWGW